MILALVLLVATGEPTTKALTSTPTEPHPKTPMTMPPSLQTIEKAWIQKAPRLRISHGTGNLAGSDVSTFDLRRQGDVFVGTAIWVVRLNEQSPLADSGSITVPAAAIDAVLRAFAFAARKTPAAVDDLRATIKPADDYPWWSVEVDGEDICNADGCVPGPVARFESPAAALLPAPWFAVSADGSVELDAVPLNRAARIAWGLLGEEPIDAMRAIARRRAMKK